VPPCQSWSPRCSSPRIAPVQLAADRRRAAMSILVVPVQLAADRGSRIGSSDRGSDRRTADRGARPGTIRPPAAAHGPAACTLLNERAKLWISRKERWSKNKHYSSFANEINALKIFPGINKLWITSVTKHQKKGPHYAGRKGQSLALFQCPASTNCCASSCAFT
jgi:hypothetical protein